MAPNVENKLLETASVGSVPPAERTLMLEMPYLESQYGPIYPVTNIDGTVDIYDEQGGLVASVTVDGQLEFLCYDDPPAYEHGVCDPAIQSCPDLPDAEQFTYNDPWTIDESWFTGGNPFEKGQDEGQALSNSTKKFAECCEDYAVFDDSPVDAMALHEALPEGRSPFEKSEKSEVCDSETAVSGAKGAEPKAAAHEEIFTGSASGPAGSEPSGVIAPPAWAQQQGAEISLGSFVDLAAVAIKETMERSRLLTVDKHMPSRGATAASVQNVVEALSSSLARYAKELNQSLADALIKTFRGIVCELKKGLDKESGGYLAHAENAHDGPANIGADRPSAPAGAVARSSAASPGGSGRGRDPISAGAVAMHDPAGDPYSIALAHMDKGGPPYFITITSGVATSPTAVHDSSHDRVLAARAHGDAHHHHGEQEGDGRGQDQQEEYYPEAEIEADSEAFV